MCFVINVMWGLECVPTVEETQIQTDIFEMTLSVFVTQCANTCRCVCVSFPHFWAPSVSCSNDVLCSRLLQDVGTFLVIQYLPFCVCVCVCLCNRLPFSFLFSLHICLCVLTFCVFKTWLFTPSASRHELTVILRLNIKTHRHTH